MDALQRDYMDTQMSDRDELQAWREWAQFVYLGNAAMDDAAMRAAVCAAHDAETDALRAELAQVTQQRDKWLDAFNRSEQFQNGPTKRAEAAKAKLADAERRIAAAVETFELTLRYSVSGDRRGVMYQWAGGEWMHQDDVRRIVALLSAESPR